MHHLRPFPAGNPDLLNAGKKQRGELVSCFLLCMEDNMESIGRAPSTLHCSSQAAAAWLAWPACAVRSLPLRRLSQSSGVIPVMKLLEDAFSYANQLGARQNCRCRLAHTTPTSPSWTPSVRTLTKIRIKTLSLGVVIPDITFERRRRTRHVLLPYVWNASTAYPSPTSTSPRGTTDGRRCTHHQDQDQCASSSRPSPEIQFESGYVH